MRQGHAALFASAGAAVPGAVTRVCAATGTHRCARAAGLLAASSGFIDALPTILVMRRSSCRALVHVLVWRASVYQQQQQDSPEGHWLLQVRCRGDFLKHAHNAKFLIVCVRARTRVRACMHDCVTVCAAVKPT
jgi:hypothetical protein